MRCKTRALIRVSTIASYRIDIRDLRIFLESIISRNRS